LVKLVEDGVITGVKPESINGASIDVHLGDTFISEDPIDGFVDLAKRQPFNSAIHKLGLGETFHLAPGAFCLASTKEMFYLPADVCCELRLKSSGARAGLQHSFASWCDPYWNNAVLTLELKNYLQFHTLILTPGMPIGQMIFERVTPVPAANGYAVRGRYNNDISAQGVKK
jgi:dCTP deaminase